MDEKVVIFWGGDGSISGGKVISASLNHRLSTQNVKKCVRSAVPSKGGPQGAVLKGGGDFPYLVDHTVGGGVTQ